MKNTTLRSFLTSIRGAVMLTLTLTSIPSFASESQGSDGPSTVLKVPSDESGYTLPSCSKCRRVKIEVQTSNDDTTQGLLELAYYDELSRDFVGSIELTLLLPDGTEDIVAIEDVWLTQGDEVGWIIDAPLPWSWDDIDTVWVEFRATQ